MRHESKSNQTWQSRCQPAKTWRRDNFRLHPMNANFDLMETNDQGVEDRLEDTFYDLMSSGIIADMEASVPGSGLSLTVPAGQAHPSWRSEIPSCQTLVMWLILSPSNFIA